MESIFSQFKNSKNSKTRRMLPDHELHLRQILDAIQRKYPLREKESLILLVTLFIDVSEIYNIIEVKERFLRLMDETQDCDVKANVNKTLEYIFRLPGIFDFKDEILSN